VHAPKTWLRHFRDGPRVVIDLLYPATETAGKKTKKAEPTSLLSKKEPSPAPPKPVALTPAVKPPVQLTQVPEAERLVPVRSERHGNTISLVFDWDRPVGASVFARAGYIWVAFDRFRNFSLDAVLAKEKGLLKNLEYVPSREGVVLRAGPLPGLYPTLRRGGNDWVVDIHPEAKPPLAEIPVQTLSNEENGLELLMQVEGAERVIQVQDPEVGDRLFIVPVSGANVGMEFNRQYVDFSLLAAAQGIVLEPKKDLLNVEPTVRGVRVFGGRTLRISRPDDSAIGSVSDVLLTNARIFDFEGWAGFPGEAYLDTEQRLYRSLAVSDERELNAARMNLTRFYFANEMMTEAQGVLDILAETSPDIEKDLNFRALRGAVAFRNGDYKRAKEELYHASLDGDAEIALWRAALAAKAEDWAKAARGFDGTEAFLEHYPHSLQVELYLLAAEAAYRTGDLERAGKRLRTLQALNLTPAERGNVGYLDGRIHLARRDADRAVAIWDHVAAGEGREARARAAFAAVQLKLKQGDMSREEAIEQLERLRFAWRGDRLEYDLLYQLGDLYLEQKDYQHGLTALKQLITYFEDDEERRKTAQRMTKVFTSLYLEGEAAKMPLVKALAIYNAFRELTPVGKDGDRMIEILADRLVSADLLERAAKLLEYQVEYRLSGAEKVRVATRLALIQLLNRDPEGALKTLRETSKYPVAEDLSRQRLHLTVRGLAEIGKENQALALLDQDASYEADLLRVDIYQRTKDWAKAAEVFPRLLTHVEPGAELADRDLKLILSWAVALSLSGDMEKLTELHKRFEDRMAQSSYGDMFRVISPETEYATDDFLDLATKIADVDGFQAFMTSYRQQLKAKGLSALN
ncbi:MAG: tetratricopeptide repeat protein, partial [Alphaproteobacteria bacterium]